MPFSAIIRKDNNGSILRAGDGHGLLVLRVVERIVGRLHLIVRLEFMLVQIVAACPTEEEETKKAKQKEKPRFGRLIAFNIGGIIHLSAGLMLWGVHVHCERGYGCFAGDKNSGISCNFARDVSRKGAMDAQGREGLFSRSCGNT